ncbi:MAG: TIGR04211 family SH3 domain-containing protein [Deltaproteobacteria bacterium]|nr:TIGR04211 family SH3 domain-containing protein [Deltaproteobacteria bacterium]
MMTFTRCGRNHLLFILLLIILMSGSVSPAGADTRYVSDQLIISVREGPTAEDPVVGYLLTGAPVEVLEEAEKHLFVRTADGKEGWVRSKYILKELPKSMVIKELTARIDELENQMKMGGTQAGATDNDIAATKKIYDLKIKNLKTTIENEKQSSTATQSALKQLKKQHKKLLDDFNRLSRQNASLSKQSDSSEALSAEIKRLKQANQALAQEIDQIKIAGKPSSLSNSIKWFLTGGGVLLLGIILGKSVRRKKGYGY